MDRIVDVSDSAPSFDSPPVTDSDTSQQNLNLLVASCIEAPDRAEEILRQQFGAALELMLRVRTGIRVSDQHVGEAIHEVAEMLPKCVASMLLALLRRAIRGTASRLRAGEFERAEAQIDLATADVVRRYLANLPVAERNVLFAFYTDGLREDEIETETGIGVENQRHIRERFRRSHRSAPN